MELATQVEALLFFKTNGISVAEIARLLEVPEAAAREALDALRGTLAGRGIVLVNEGDMYALTTAPEMADIIKRGAAEELSGELSKAALETLSIVLYRAPVARSEIDYIRGVNSAFTVRTLLVRGLIQKISMNGAARGIAYEPTLELLAHLGVTNTSELPEYEKTREVFADFGQKKEQREKEVTTRGEEQQEEMLSDKMSDV